MQSQAELTLKQMRCLLAVEQFRHFRRASEHLGITQPSLSAQIQNLEAVLSLRLVDRDRAGVSLTPAGREIAARARMIIADEQAILDYAGRAQKGLGGTIRLGTSPTIGPYLLPFIVAALHRKYADLGLYVREETPRDLDFELGKGVHDVLLTPLPGTSADYVNEALFREPLYLAVAVDHSLAKKELLVPADIKGLKVLTLSPRYQLHAQTIELCKTFGAALSNDYEGTSLDSLRLMVGMGMGAAFLPALYVHSEVRSRSEIVVKKLSGRNLTRSISMVWRKRAGGANTYREIAGVARDIARKRFTDLIVNPG